MNTGLYAVGLGAVLLFTSATYLDSSDGWMGSFARALDARILDGVLVPCWSEMNWHLCELARPSGPRTTDPQQRLLTAAL